MRISFSFFSSQIKSNPVGVKDVNLSDRPRRYVELCLGVSHESALLLDFRRKSSSRPFGLFKSFLIRFAVLYPASRLFHGVHSVSSILIRPLAMP